MLDQIHFGARLQVAHTFPQDGDEDAPDFRLQVRRTVVQQLQHVFDVLCVLDHKVQLHVELATNQLERFKRFLWLV